MFNRLIFSEGFIVVIELPAAAIRPPGGDPPEEDGVQPHGREEDRTSFAPGSRHPYDGEEHMDTAVAEE